MKYFFLLALCSTTVLGYAQKTINVEKAQGLPQNALFSVGGVPFLNAKFVRLISGTPYFKNEWLKGIGVSDAGVTYKADNLKLDLFDNQVHFLDAAGNEIITTSPLKQLLLTDTIMNQNWNFVHSSLFPQTTTVKPGWYLQLVKGNVSLYQFFFKALSESTPYGSATTEQSIITKDEFYVYHNNSLLQVKKVKDLVTILSDKQSELENFSKNNSKGKSTAELFTAMVELYNKQ